MAIFAQHATDLFTKQPEIHKITTGSNDNQTVIKITPHIAV